MMRAKLYNHAARFCQQYIEKLLKECIHIHCVTDEDIFLLRSHRLSKLATRCKEHTGIKFSAQEILYFRELTDYYFDTNYPGANYLEIDQEEAERVYNATLEFQQTYESILTAREN